MTAFELARFCYTTLMRYGRPAKLACEQHQVTPALEHVIEANTLLSGLGFESGGLAAAHAIHNGLTVLPATHKYWHGERLRLARWQCLCSPIERLSLSRRFINFVKI